MGRFGSVWELLDEQVASGRLPGYVAAVRCAGEVEVRAGGSRTLGGPPMTAATPFRLASVTKPFAGALTLALVEDGVLGIDEAVGRWLPELAAPRVTARRGGSLSETVPAERPITVRHLLTNTAGLGWAEDIGPLDEAMAERGVGPGPYGPELSPDEFTARLGELPLSGQPGATWNYHTCSDVLSVLLARATGRSVADLLAERVTGPLGLASTGFAVADPSALPTLYWPGDDGLEVADPPAGVYGTPRPFESLAAGLLAPAADVLALFCAIADGGAPVFSAASAAAMTHDALPPVARAVAAPFLGPDRTWGFQVGVDVAGPQPGRWGWEGGTGTSAWADPGHDLVGVLLTQRFMTGAHDSPDAFWAALVACS